MLTNVPDAVNRMTRNVIMNHPNTFNCQLFRKVITRKADETVGGNPTLGGLGVLDTMDEEEFEYEFVGNGYALLAEPFTPAPVVSRHDASLSTEDEFRFLIQPEGESGSDEWFDVRKHDVMYLLLGIGPQPARLAFEIIGTETTSNIPPYTTRYVANRRDDLHLREGE
ncbi:hypothetical protein [Burkholderia plantarii]|uniref:Uncharacterized protein n=1 Tax=Burkholderia plantarii TaxID=41899 RepID=A0A0B6RYT3_BURPL|nr:hypothetical protein [Burkholderia plantarii]AJK46230.1 hypothetical protein BGL_1c17210 [Burkholderia plantarii]